MKSIVKLLFCLASLFVVNGCFRNVEIPEDAKYEYSLNDGSETIIDARDIQVDTVYRLKIKDNDDNILVSKLVEYRDYNAPEVNFDDIVLIKKDTNLVYSINVVDNFDKNPIIQIAGADITNEGLYEGTILVEDQSGNQTLVENVTIQVVNDSYIAYGAIIERDFSSYIEFVNLSEGLTIDNPSKEAQEEASEDLETSQDEKSEQTEVSE